MPKKKPETPWTDEHWLKAIWESVDDPKQAVELLFAYYRDADRADRTSRAQMYLHLGMLSGLVLRLLSGQPR